MNDSNKIDLRKVGTWLSGEVELRVPNAWLAIAGVAIVVLLIVALD
jgi:hypothetical protein